MPVRGVGTTTEQIKRSPPNAVYIFQGARKYFEDLGRQLGRTDLTMRDALRFDPDMVRGTRNAVIIDHSVFSLEKRVLEIIHAHNSHPDVEGPKLYILKIQATRDSVLVYAGPERFGIWEGQNRALLKIVRGSKTAYRMGSLVKQFYYGQLVGTEWHILGEAPWQEW